MNKNIRIAFDIDDTITNAVGIYNYSLTSEFIKMKGITKDEFISNNNRYKEEYESFSFPRVVNSVPPMLYIKEFMTVLIEFGFELFIITKRDRNYNKTAYTGELMYQDTIKWFHLNKIPIEPENMFFGCQDKAKTCVSNEISILFENEPDNIVNVSRVCPVIFPVYPYNIFTYAYDGCFPLNNTLRYIYAYESGTFNSLQLALLTLPKYNEYYREHLEELQDLASNKNIYKMKDRFYKLRMTKEEDS